MTPREIADYLIIVAAIAVLTSSRRAALLPVVDLGDVQGSAGCSTMSLGQIATLESGIPALATPPSIQQSQPGGPRYGSKFSTERIAIRMARRVGHGRRYPSDGR